MTETDDLPGEADLSRHQKVEFAEFYMAEMPRLVAFIMRFGAGLSEANDIAQQAFVNAYPRWPTIRRPAAYLRTSQAGIYPPQL